MEYECRYYSYGTTNIILHRASRGVRTLCQRANRWHNGFSLRPLSVCSVHHDWNSRALFYPSPAPCTKRGLKDPIRLRRPPHLRCEFLLRAMYRDVHELLALSALLVDKSCVDADERRGEAMVNRIVALVPFVPSRFAGWGPPYSHCTVRHFWICTEKSTGWLALTRSRLETTLPDRADWTENPTPLYSRSHIFRRAINIGEAV